MTMWLSNLKQGFKKGFLNPDKNLIRRWPKDPKIAFIYPPNSFGDELTQRYPLSIPLLTCICRFAIDLGIPVISMSQLLGNIAEQAGQTPEYDHPFYLRVRDIVRAGDADALLRDKIYLKVLRLTPEAQGGFVLVDFPETIGEAEQLETFRGGLNAAVSVSLPDHVLVELEEAKVSCTDCGKAYYRNEVADEDLRIHIQAHTPADHGHCDDCGSSNFTQGDSQRGGALSFEQQLEAYRARKDNILGFYDTYVSFRQIILMNIGSSGGL
jgi:adenylate kinase family enzyme